MWRKHPPNPAVVKKKPRADKKFAIFWRKNTAIRRDPIFISMKKGPYNFYKFVMILIHGD